MKKIVLLLFVFLIVVMAAFIPFSHEQTITVKASFFNVYQQLSQPGNWKRWRNDLRQISPADTGKVSVMKQAAGFQIQSPNLKLAIKPVNGYSFLIDEVNSGKMMEYAYTVLPGKFPNETVITATQKSALLTNLLNHGAAATRTHIADLKSFMEDPALYYGYPIVKKKVTDTDIVVLRQVVLAKNKFSAAARNLAVLKNYLAANGLKQTQPLIAQFFPRGIDSVQLNIGLPVNKKAPAAGLVNFMQMPGSGSVYTVNFRGRFNQRAKVYAAVHRYFTDREIQVPILPFETYLNDKLPLQDTDTINIRINFPTF